MNTAIFSKIFSGRFSFAFPRGESAMTYQKYYFFCHSCSQHHPRTELSTKRMAGSRSLCKNCETGQSRLPN